MNIRQTMDVGETTELGKRAFVRLCFALPHVWTLARPIAQLAAVVLILSS